MHATKEAEESCAPWQSDTPSAYVNQNGPVMDKSLKVDNAIRRMVIRESVSLELLPYLLVGEIDSLTEEYAITAVLNKYLEIKKLTHKMENRTGTMTGNDDCLSNNYSSSDSSWIDFRLVKQLVCEYIKIYNQIFIDQK